MITNLNGVKFKKRFTYPCSNIRNERKRTSDYHDVWRSIQLTGIYKGEDTLQTSTKPVKRDHKKTNTKRINNQ